jgi:hypothetical protein
MRLSVVIPCYNELNTIGEVLNSVLGYSGTEKEIIIVDDGSTDGTRQFLQEQVDGKLARVIFLEDNQGAGGGNKVGTATVTIFGDNGVAQFGYMVSGTFGGDFDESPAAEATGPDGTVSVQTGVTSRGKTSVTFCVDSVSGDKPYKVSDNASNSYACP